MGNWANYDKDTNLSILVPNEYSMSKILELIEQITNIRRRTKEIIDAAKEIRTCIKRLRPYDPLRDSIFLPLWWIERER